MKHFYFLVALVIAGGSVTAQQVKDLPSIGKSNYPAVSADLVTTTSGVRPSDHLINRLPGDAIFTEDFASGIGSWTTSGADGALWLYDTDGPNGTFSDPVNQIITSTSVANGFMIFDTDFSNTLNGALDPNFTFRVGNLTSPTIDLTGISNAVIEFQHAYRHCCSNDFVYRVSVSDDGFTSNIATFEVPDKGVVGVNDNFRTDVTKVDISGFLSTASSLSTVQIRFEHDGNQPDGNSSTTSHYFWQIDDIVVRESHDVDLRMYSGNFYSTAYQLSYYQTPLHQVGPFEFSGEYCNFGGSAAPGAALDIDINAGAFTTSSAGGSLNAGSCDSVGATGTFSPAALGTYDVSFMASTTATEGDATDNEETDQFIITQDIYSQATTVRDGGFDGFISNIAGGTGSPFQIGSVHYIENNTFLTSVGIGLSGTSGTYDGTGELVYAVIYQFDANLGDYVYVDQSSDHTITAADQGAMVVLPLSTVIPLVAGDDILVVMGHYGGTTDVRLATAGTSQEGTVLGYDGSNSLFQLLTPGTPAIDLYLSETDPSGIEEATYANGITLNQNRPNPAANNTTISYELAQAGNVTIEVYDIAGKKVMDMNEGNKAAGNHNINLSTAGMNAGIYYYTLTSNGQRASKKMTVLK